MPRGEKQKKDMRGDPSNIKQDLEFGMKLATWANCDPISLHDVERVKERVQGYFDLCLEYGHRPTVTELAMALNTRREYIPDIYTGNYAHPGLGKIPLESRNAIIMGYNLIRNGIEQSIARGNGNPVGYIFLAKSMGIKDHDERFDYQTQKETPNIEQLKTQYLHQLPDKEGD